MQIKVGKIMGLVVALSVSTAHAGLIVTNTVSDLTITEGQVITITYGMEATNGDHLTSGVYSYNLGNGSGLSGGPVIHGTTESLQTRQGSFYVQDGNFTTRVNGGVTVHNSNHSVDSSTGSFSQQGPSVTVSNVAPTITQFSLGSLSIFEGQSVTAYMQATDPGLLDELRFEVNVNPSTGNGSNSPLSHRLCR